jgi:HK97 family phage portal protein
MKLTLNRPASPPPSSPNRRAFNPFKAFRRDSLTTAPPRLPQLMRAIADHNDMPFAAPLAPDYADHYLRSSWVHTAVARIAEAGALVPLEVYQRRGEQRIAQQNHPLERLLGSPNPLISGFELIESTLGWLELAGNAYWYLAADSDGLPAEVWPLRPERVRIVPDPLRFVAGYVYTLDAQEITLTPDQVIHFKRWHPVDDFYGLSTLSAAALASQADRAMARWNLSIFGKQAAVPAGVVTFRNNIPDAELERVRREWNDAYGGGERKTAFVRGAELSWQNIGLNQMESDFLNGRRFNRDEILQIFGVPAALYEKDATRANALAARQTFLEQTIWPKLIRITEKITGGLAPFFGPDLIVRPAEIRDREADLRELEAARGILTTDELRERYFGLKPASLTPP